MDFEKKMAKRKSRKAVKKPLKKHMKLETVFTCPFCDHPESVKCIMDKKIWIGETTCLLCNETFFTTITALSEPIDIYHEWIDECERANYNGGR